MDVEPHLDGRHTLSDEALPGVYRNADREAARAQSRLFHLTAVVLVLAFVASVFGTFSLKASHVDWAALGSVIALGGGIAASDLLRRHNPNRRWYAWRALAESVKTLAWLYSVAGGDFGRDQMGDDAAEHELASRIAAIEAEYGDLTPPREHTGVVSDAMARLRRAPLDARRATYEVDRLSHQRDWYLRRAGQHEARRDVWAWASIALQTAAFGLAALRFFEVIDFDLVGIATTAAAAAVAWQRGHDHAGLAEAYKRTAQELSELVRTVGSAAGERAWAAFVANAEMAMSREHTSWWARRRQVQAS
jgi:hypothetical protein